MFSWKNRIATCLRNDLCITCQRYRSDISANAQDSPHISWTRRTVLRQTDLIIQNHENYRKHDKGSVQVTAAKEAGIITQKASCRDTAHTGRSYDRRLPEEVKDRIRRRTDRTAAQPGGHGHKPVCGKHGRKRIIEIRCPNPETSDFHMHMVTSQLAITTN